MMCRLIRQRQLPLLPCRTAGHFPLFAGCHGRAIQHRFAECAGRIKAFNERRDRIKIDWVATTAKDPQAKIAAVPEFSD